MPHHSILRKKITLLFSALLIIMIYHFSNPTENTDIENKDITYNIPIVGSVEFGDPNAHIVIIKWTDFQ